MSCGYSRERTRRAVRGSDTFTLKTGVSIYGGFAGIETLLGERDPATNVTTLSGEIGAAGASDNSYHVVTGGGADSTALLDGFTITAGNANGSSPDDGGGGMYNVGSSLILTNVIFYANAAVQGGGMYNLSSGPTLTNVVFSGNNGTSPIYNYGGGMYNNGSSPSLTDVVFTGNFTNPGRAGGMYNYLGSNPTLTNVTFSGNSTVDNGGGMANFQSSPTLSNVTFSGNSSSDSGGGMSNYQSNATLTNVTFSNNSAPSGGGLQNLSSSPMLKNTLIANSLSGGDCVNVSSTLNAASSNNLIEDGTHACGLTDGVNANIIGQDPKLGPLGYHGGFTQTRPLLSGSSAIDNGDDTLCAAAPVSNLDQRGMSAQSTATSMPRQCATSAPTSTRAICSQMCPSWAKSGWSHGSNRSTTTASPRVAAWAR